MKIVRIKQGYFGTRELVDIDFPYAGGPTVGKHGLFIKVNGINLPGWPQRNFKIHVEGPSSYTIYDGDQPPSDEEEVISSEEEITDDEMPESDRPEGYVTRRTKPDVVSAKPLLAGHTPWVPPTSSGVLTGGLLGHADAPDTNEPDDVITERMIERFEILQQMAIAAAHGTVRGMVITGAPGIGKSYEAIQALEKENVLNKMQYMLDGPAIHGDAEEINEDDEDLEINEDIPNIKTYFLHKGYVSASALYAVLYNNRRKGEVTVFDDTDSALLDDTSLELLKSALDSSERRIISWSTMDRKDDLPPQFEFEGAVIFITNINFERTVREGRSKLTPHLAAIMDRCLYLDLMIETMREKLLRIDYIAKETGMLKNKGYTPEEAEEILEFVHTNCRQFRELSLRKVLQLAGIYKMGPNWQKVARFTLMKGVR